MSDEDKIKATVFFMDTLSKRQLAEFIVNLNGAVDGLSRNNADYSRVFGEKCAEIARLTAALEWYAKQDGELYNADGVVSEDAGAYARLALKGGA